MPRSRLIAITTASVVVLAAAVYTPLTLLAPIDPVAAEVTVEPPAANPALQFQGPDTGKAAIGLREGHDVLWSSADDKASPMASLTKLITAFVVLEKHPLDGDESGPSIQLTRADQAIYDQYWLEGVKILPFTAGTSYTERELLEIALIESAANYTDRLVLWAYGSKAAFVQAARAWLHDHELDGITIVDPIGLDAANAATPSQLIELGRLAMADPIISEIVGTKHVSVHGLGSLTNTNPILGIDGVDGIKTGNLENFGSNLLFSAALDTEAGPLPVIGVVLGGDDVGGTVQTMLGDLRDSFHRVELAAVGEEFATFETEWGDTADVVAAESASLVVWGDDPIEFQVTVDSVLTGKKGDQVGTATFTAGDQVVTVPLELTRTIDDPGPWWRLGHPGLIFGAA